MPLAALSAALRSCLWGTRDSARPQGSRGPEDGTLSTAVPACSLHQGGTQRSADNELQPAGLSNVRPWRRIKRVFAIDHASQPSEGPRGRICIPVLPEFPFLFRGLPTFSRRLHKRELSGGCLYDLPTAAVGKVNIRAKPLGHPRQLQPP